MYRDLWGLESGWLKRFCIAIRWRLYCKKWLDCIAAWGKIVLQELHCIAIESAVGWIELYCNRFKCIARWALYCSLGVVAGLYCKRRLRLYYRFCIAENGG